MSRNQLALAACAALLPALSHAEAPRVAADIAPVHSLVSRVMEGVGAPDLIVAAGASPHEYSLRPSEAAALQDAALVFWVGAELTPWLDQAVGTLAAQARVVSLLALEETNRLEFREGALFEAHDHDDHDDEDHGGDHAEDDHGHDHGDDHGHDHGEAATDEDHADHDHDHGKEEDHAGHDHDHGEDHAAEEQEGHDHAGHDHGAHDPHAWLSPDNAAVWLDAIAAALSEADPANAARYAGNAAAGRAELASLTQEIEAALAPVRDRRFIVFHDAYQYFEQAFGISASGAIALSDAADPSPARIAEIRDRVAQQGVDCVLSEPQFNPGLVATVLDGTEAKTAVLDPLGSDLEPGPGLYPQMLRNLSAALSGCLG